MDFSNILGWHILRLSWRKHVGNFISGEMDYFKQLACPANLNHHYEIRSSQPTSSSSLALR
jgi:hypothetical protein